MDKGHNTVASAFALAVLFWGASTSHVLAQQRVSYDYKGCQIGIEGPIVSFSSNGTDSVSAVVQTSGTGCSPSWIRLRHERRWWPDRNLITARNPDQRPELNAIHRCSRGGGMRVFAEAKVKGKKFRSRPKKGVSVPLCH